MEIKMKELSSFSVTPLHTDHVEEICADIKRQIETGVSSMPIFSMTLVPVGTPVCDKASVMVEKYLKFKSRLDSMGIPSGILVQATIGHGGKLAAPSPFRKMVGLLKESGEVVCPYDEDFRAHMREVFSRLAAAKPAHIMVDDDFRLIDRADGGCVCELHLARFNELAGTSFDKEGLKAALMGENAEKYIKIFVETQREALLGAARAMREGIDAVDKTIPGSFCACGNNAEFAEEIAEILAGEGNPVTVRINNGNYTPAGPRGLSYASYRAAIQSERIRKSVDIILAETDTCPQNRYSTGAYSLHSHFTLSILEGCAGAKHWITRMAEHESKSGEAYRRVLSKYSGFHKALAELVPSLEWQGCRIPLSEKRCFIFEGGEWFRSDGGEGFATHVLERLGIPLYFSSKEGGAVFFSGKGDKKFTDAELREMLSGNVFLAAESAVRFIERGLGEYLGVDVRSYTGKRATGEHVFINGKRMAPQMQIHEITPICDGVVAHSEVVHSLDGSEREYLFPGVTSYKNSLGGTAVVFSGTPITRFHYAEAFSFLNESRKAQLVSLLRELGNLPVYYEGDEEVYLRAAKTACGSLFVCLFNIGTDPIDEITLSVEKAYTGVDVLTPDGKWQSADFTQDGEHLTVRVPAVTLAPVAMILK